MAFLRKIVEIRKMEKKMKNEKDALETRLPLPRTVCEDHRPMITK